MINEFTDYVLAKRRNAILATVFFSFLPLLNAIAYVTLNLVTLQRGARQGGEVLVALTLSNIVLAFFSFYISLNADIMNTVEMMIYFNFCSFAAALLLREYKSWFLTIECCCYLGLVIILVTHIMYPDLTAYWLDIIDKQLSLISELLGDASIRQVDVEAFKHLAKNATGLRALMIICSIIFYLILGRWMQTRRFSPGKLRQELQLLRADYVSLVIVGMVMIGSYMDFPTAQDMHNVAILPMVLTGLSIIHNFALTRKHWFILIMSFYMVFSLFLTLVIGLLIFLAILDLFIDIRGKYNGYNTARTYQNR